MSVGPPAIPIGMRSIIPALIWPSFSVEVVIFDPHAGVKHAGSPQPNGTDIHYADSHEPNPSFPIRFCGPLGPGDQTRLADTAGTNARTKRRAFSRSTRSH